MKPEPASRQSLRESRMFEPSMVLLFGGVMVIGLVWVFLLKPILSCVASKY